MDRPFFTVVMPAYGVEKYLKESSGQYPEPDL